ncbi:MAG TPA: RodZ domain-containing protein [Myxococcaceae bacterium]
MPGTTTGIGPALRQARETLGKSLEEAGRDTRIRPDYLSALERESFHTLRGDVYVRGFLRSYSAYLGLDPDKVLSVYADMAVPVSRPDEVPPPKPLRHQGIRILHRKGNWKLALLVAVVLLVSFWAFGMLTRSKPAPTAGGAATTAPATEDPAAPFVSISVTANQKTDVAIVSDGSDLFSGTMRAGHTREFTAGDLLHVTVSCGACVVLSVNGSEPFTPEQATGHYQASFTPQDFRSTPPSPGG